jgi:hypothetical protein
MGHRARGGRTDGLAGELAGELSGAWAGQNLRWVETMLLGFAGALLGILGWVLLAPVGNGSGGAGRVGLLCSMPRRGRRCSGNSIHLRAMAAAAQVPCR